MTLDFEKIKSEPFRLFFPIGTFFLLWGALLWVPLLWSPGAYPVLTHRYLMLNGFAASFIGGFLMTAVPRFSQTSHAQSWEVVVFLLITLIGLGFAFFESEKGVFISSGTQALLLLLFLLQRIPKRKVNPPYSFIFIFVGLLLWVASGVLGAFLDAEAFKRLHYEGAIASIILGVGSRLIPGILGHVEIVQAQRKVYETPRSLLQTVPLHFHLFIISFIVSYFLSEGAGELIRALVVVGIATFYWRLWSLPKERTALTFSIWTAGWLIVLSFLLPCFLDEGKIHLGHSFFINGVVLLSLLVATRVIQSHGPKDKTLEDRKVLYVITLLLLLSASTRVSAFFMPEQYLSHLAYSALLLVLSVAIWARSYLRFLIP